MTKTQLYRSQVILAALISFAPELLQGQSNTLPSSGNVGIGTTTPSLPLTVKGGNALARFESSAASSLIFFTPNGFDEWRIGAGDLNINDFAIRNSTRNTSAISITGGAIGGNVGIGTTTPGARLEINGNASGYPASSGTNQGYASARLSNSQTNGVLDIGVNSAGGAWFQYTNRTDLSESYPILINPNGGNVGIGTVTPSEKLTVRGNMSKSGSWILGDSAWGTNTFEVHTSSWNGTENGEYGGVAAGHGYFYKGLQSGGGSGSEAAAGELYVGGTTMLMGNVGIGTTTPSHKLAVVGTIRANEIIVDTGWSDYVFDENYKLENLSATEAFIRSEKHLPGIPSAREVAEHGISVGAMQAKLLAKIEELTLHVIEQDKRSSTLDERFKEQQNRLDSLERENQRLTNQLNAEVAE